MKSEGSYKLRFESTGRVVSANNGIVGLNEKLEEVFEGYDGSIEHYYKPPEERLTPEERRELADYMIALWNKYADEGLREPTYD